MSAEDVVCYKLYAANCVEMAERIADTERRVFLLRMAQAWSKLAEQVEKSAKGEPADAFSATQSDPKQT